MQLKLYNNPDGQTVESLVKRPQQEHSRLRAVVSDLFNQVRESGDSALLRLTERFDGVKLNELSVERDVLEMAGRSIDPKLKKAIAVAKENIEKFHCAQIIETRRLETFVGVECWQKYVPIEKIGLYIPGGSAPLFSTVLMLAVPAAIAGCRDIVLCTPPGETGQIHPAILYTAKLCGVTAVYKAGGAQAIAAMTFGTETIPSVYKIFGPGNQYVTAAKMMACEYGVAIDLPAGPSEVLVFADESAIPSFVASDLLSQAEHGEDSQVGLVSTNKDMILEINRELSRQIVSLPRKSIARKVLENSFAVLFDRAEKAFDFVNAYAPEHLILASENAELLEDLVFNAGSVFMGNYTPESAGDYASGTNHTLPTNGFAKTFSGVTLQTYMKSISFQKIQPKGIKTLGPFIETMAENEALEAHARSVRIRIDHLNNPDYV